MHLLLCLWLVQLFFQPHFCFCYPLFVIWWQINSTTNVDTSCTSVDSVTQWSAQKLISCWYSMERIKHFSPSGSWLLTSARHGCWNSGLLRKRATLMTNMKCSSKWNSSRFFSFKLLLSIVYDCLMYYWICNILKWCTLSSHYMAKVMTTFLNMEWNSLIYVHIIQVMIYLIYKIIKKYHRFVN